MIILIMLNLFFIHNLFSQCDCEKIYRSDATIMQCKTLPIGGDRNLQLGVSLLSNGKDRFIALTIRYVSGLALKITGDLNVRLLDNNMLTFPLVTNQSSYIGNSEVENGIFLINESQFYKIKNANLLTISITLSDKKMHTIEASINKDVLINQGRCL
jgi:hypothetical protein